MGFYDEKYKIASDRAFYIKCFLSNQFVFKHVNYPLTVFDLDGMSNDSSHKIKKETEDEQIFKEYFGVFYDDYKKIISLQNQLNEAKRATLYGICKRGINKIKYLCGIR